MDATLQHACHVATKTSKQTGKIKVKKTQVLQRSFKYQSIALRLIRLQAEARKNDTSLSK